MIVRYPVGNVTRLVVSLRVPFIFSSLILLNNKKIYIIGNILAQKSFFFANWSHFLVHWTLRSSYFSLWDYRNLEINCFNDKF